MILEGVSCQDLKDWLDNHVTQEIFRDLQVCKGEFEGLLLNTRLQSSFSSPTLVLGDWIGSINTINRLLKIKENFAEVIEEGNNEGN